MATMKALRDGYFDGVYVRAGDIVAVGDEYAATLHHAGFAIHAEQPKPDEPPPAPAPPPPPQPRKR